MTRRRFYVLLLVAFVIGLIAIVTFPAESLTFLTIAVPVSIASAVISVLYLRRVYHRQEQPRSRFFGMTLETFYSLVVLGGWVGYLTVARVTERAIAAGVLTWSIPAPPPSISAPVSGLLILVVFAGPTRFALDLYLTRRRSSASQLDLEDARRVEFPATREE